MDAPAVETPTPYWTDHQAAKYLQISRSTLAGWRCNGGGPKYCLISTRVRYLQKDLDEWVQSCHTKKKVSPHVGRPPGVKSKPHRKKKARP
jgi:predicted DNA-binding transcriptional regulator AlpA